MGDFLSDEVQDPFGHVAALTGRTGAEASQEASRLQAEVGREGIAVQERFQNQLLEQLRPFIQFGEGNIGGLQDALGRNPGSAQLNDLNRLLENPQDRLGQVNRFLSSPADTPALNRLNQLTNDPNAQRDFIQNNPFFNALAGDAQNRIFNNQAARGKVGSGETAAGLQNELTKLGSSLLSQEIGNLSNTAGLNLTANQSRFGNLLQGASANIGQDQNRLNSLFQGAGINSDIGNRQIANLFNAVGMGQNAAALQGQGQQGVANNITDLTTGIGNALAAGGVGAANAYGQGAQNVAGLGAGLLSIFASDRRLKVVHDEIGTYHSEKTDHTYPTYLYNYVGSEIPVVGVMAQDVEKINPQAVLYFMGVKYVNYAEL